MVGRVIWPGYYTRGLYYSIFNGGMCNNYILTRARRRRVIVALCPTTSCWHRYSSSGNIAKYALRHYCSVTPIKGRVRVYVLLTMFLARARECNGSTWHAFQDVFLVCQFLISLFTMISVEQCRS